MVDDIVVKMRIFEDDHAWLNDNLKTLQRTHGEQWIAVHKRQVIAASLDLDELLEMVPNPTEICIGFVSTESLEMVL